MSTRLAQQTQKTAGIPNGMRTATVAAVDATTGAVTISVSGGQFSSGVGVLGSYSPLVGDNVAVFRQDSSWLVLGLASAVWVGGRVGTAKVVANSASFTAITVVATVVVNLVIGQTYACEFHTRVSSATAGDFVLGRIKQDTVAGADVTVNGLYVGTTTASGFSLNLYGEYTATATGPKTFVATLELSTGTGTIALRASATGASLLTVDCIPGGGVYQ